MTDDAKIDDSEARSGGDGRREVRVPAPLIAPGVVLVGRFNPAIFQPAWMASNKLIRNEESTAAKGLIVLPDFLAFGTAWFRIEVTDDRFQAVCLEGGHEGPLRDLVLGIFAVLEHTPFEKMGINYSAHQSLESDDEFARIESRLNDRSPFSDFLQNARLRTLVVDGDHDHAPGAKIQIKVEPSRRVRPGLFVATNEHYDESGVEAGRRLMELFDKRWDGALAYARDVVSHLYSMRHEAR